jgi:hypothetical protein
MKKIYIISLLIIIGISAKAHTNKTYNFTQLFPPDSCKVLMPDISGKYSGKCKNGFAQGNGIAEGKDKYEGHFKNGWPDGKGKYTWANGDIYDGDWNGGKRNGKGKSTYKKVKADSVVYGIWEDDKFIKIFFPEPYNIIIARYIDRYSVIKVGEGKGGNRICLKLKRAGFDNLNVTNYSFLADNGSYQQEGNYFVYDQVVFPVAIKINYSTPNKFNTGMVDVVFQITIAEPGDWDIILTN